MNWLSSILGQWRVHESCFSWFFLPYILIAQSMALIWSPPWAFRQHVHVGYLFRNRFCYCWILLTAEIRAADIPRAKWLFERLFYCHVPECSLQDRNSFPLGKVNWQNVFRFVFTPSYVYVCLSSCASDREKWPQCRFEFFFSKTILNDGSRLRKRYSLSVVDGHVQYFDPKVAFPLVIKGLETIVTQRRPRVRRRLVKIQQDFVDQKDNFFMICTEQ